LIRYLLILLALAALGLTACAPCNDYCEEQCVCDGNADGDVADEACVDACHETLELYSSDVRNDECTARLEALQEECR
jgi:hypothetical protein